MNEPPETEPTQPQFSDLGLSEDVLAALADVGYETPSAVQAATIPPLVAGRDVVGLAQTGTGKTAAFALPVLSRLERDGASTAPQALVLAPTRELALQVCEAFERYAARSRGVHVLPVTGGRGYGVQLSALRRGVDVVVGTPGRVMDHLERGTLDLSRIRFLVLDEADEMLAMGFVDDIETILAGTPADKQTALFSATMPAPIRRISKRFLNDPQEVKVQGRTATASDIRQRVLTVPHHRKLDALTRILEVEAFEAMIVFVRTKQATETLAERLRARGFSAAAINGDVVQAQREKTVQQLRGGDLDVLVATDVAARGLDVERISHVVNHDLPTDAESYVHRVGRTGRAGRSGDAISFATPREKGLVKAIERGTKGRLEPMDLPSVEDVNSTRLARFDDAITAALADTDRVDFFRDVVSHYVHHHDADELSVAAALAVVQQGDEPLLLDAEAMARAAEAERRDRGPSSGPGGGPRGGSDGGGGRKPGARRRDAVQRSTYRIAVGKRHRVEPRQIVGALANEGGLSREDFGRITIRGDFSLVELPARLPDGAWDKLKSTRISGQLIDLRPDKGSGGPREA